MPADLSRREPTPAATAPGPVDLAELEALAEKATPGPWTAEPNTHAGRVWLQRAPLHRGKDCEPLFAFRDLGTKATDEAKREAYAQREADADFIAAMRNAAPSLFAAVRAIERVRALHRPRTGMFETLCAECRKPPPCPTVAALDGAS